MTIQATVVGNVGQDAELKDFEGTSMLEFSVAAKGKKTGDETETLWVRCAVWGTRADALQEYLTRGRFVVVTGTLLARSYVDAKENARVGLDMRVDNVVLGPTKAKKDDDDDSEPEERPKAKPKPAAKPAAKSGKASGRR